MITENISDNIICNWNIIKHNHPQSSYNIISIVYFVMKKNYKDNDIYYNGLLDIVNKFENLFPTFILRIYYDESSSTNVDKILNSISTDLKKKIELFKYDIPLLQDKDKYHYGIIGTLIRFLPLHSYDLHKVDICLMFDIDTKLNKKYSKSLNSFIDTDYPLIYRSPICYFDKRVTCTGVTNNALMATGLLQKITVPKKIFNDFLENVFIKNKLDKYLESCGLKDKYSYGLDEIYLNKNYLDYFYQNKMTLCLVLGINYDVLSGLNKYIDRTNNIKQLKIYYNYLINIYKLFNININFEQFIPLMNDNKISFDDIKKQIISLMIHDDTWYDHQNKATYAIKHKRREFLQILIQMLKNKELPNIHLLINCIYNNFKIRPYKVNICEIKTDFINNKKKVLSYKYMIL